jgi:hypothetical protein
VCVTARMLGWGCCCSCCHMCQVEVGAPPRLPLLLPPQGGSGGGGAAAPEAPIATMHATARRLGWGCHCSYHHCCRHACCHEDEEVGVRCHCSSGSCAHRCKEEVVPLLLLLLLPPHLPLQGGAGGGGCYAFYPIPIPNPFPFLITSLPTICLPFWPAFRSPLYYYV